MWKYIGQYYSAVKKNEIKKYFTNKWMELETLRKVKPCMLPLMRVLSFNLLFCMLNLMHVEAKKPETGNWGGQQREVG